MKKHTDYSSSEFACQYWQEPEGWRDSGIWANLTEAVDAHNRIAAAFPMRHYRVIERVITERVICENAGGMARELAAQDSKPPNRDNG